MCSPGYALNIQSPLSLSVVVSSTSVCPFVAGPSWRSFTSLKMNMLFKSYVII